METGKLVLNMGNHDSVARHSTTLIKAAMKNLIKKLCLYLSGASGVSILFGCALNPAETNYHDYQTKTNLTFPLNGESLIAAGGRAIDQNPAHIYVTDQRFAIDIVALAPGSSPPPKEGFVKRLLSGELKQLYQGNDFRKNANHYCFGRQVIAPGDGMVADTKNEVYDNVPGNRNTRDLPGNYVVIDHLNGEFSMLAHFRKDSVSVKRGDRVSAGDPLGQCGNSGHSNLPHLHYHLQNTPHWLDGEGLPAQFHNYYANGKFIQRGEPIQREIISNRL